MDCNYFSVCEWDYYIKRGDTCLFKHGVYLYFDRNEKGEPHLHEPDDWVRLEVEAALTRGTWVVPILVGGARMPPASTLPDSIRRLSRIQAFELTDRRWDGDFEQLATMIASHIPAIDHFGRIERKNRNGDGDQPLYSMNVTAYMASRAVPHRRL